MIIKYIFVYITGELNPNEKSVMKVVTSFLICTLFALSIAGSAMALEMGELDTSFGTDGLVSTRIGHFEDQAYALTVQPDGRILVAGSSSNGANLDFALVRYNEDGTLDGTFNIDGTVTTQVGRGDDGIAAVALQDDGYIIAAGYSIKGGSKNFALARYTPEGLLDYSFGQGGLVVTSYGSMDDEIMALSLDEEGRIVVAGYSTGTTGKAVVVARYLTSGNLDITFGYEGMSLTGIGDDALARSLDIDSSGRIVVAGSYSYGQRTEVMVLRFKESGDLDYDFGRDGLAEPAYVESPTEGNSVKVHENGSIAVAGSIGEPGRIDSALFLFTDRGQPESSFADNGMAVTEVSLDDDMALAVDISGDIISLSGFATVDGEREFLFITHQVQVPDVDRVSFSLKTGGSTTSLMIGERQVYTSYNEFQGEPVGGPFELVQSVVNTTPFDYFSEDTSYAVDIQADGKAVAAGFTEQGGVMTFAVARYGAAGETVGAGEFNNVGKQVTWIATREPFEVTRTGAISGGSINNSGVTITQRGVVYSIAPDPVAGGGTNIPPDPSIDTTPPRVSDTDPSNGEVNVALDADVKITWNETVECTTVTTDNITINKQAGWEGKPKCSGNQATFTPTDQANDTTYTVKVSGVKDTAGNVMDDEHSFNYTTIKATTDTLQKIEHYAGAIGGLFVGTANALTDTTTATTNTSPTSVFDLSSPQYVDSGQTDEGGGPGSYSSIIKDLKPGTLYYVRAYAVTSDEEIYYGNQLTFQTADACFIATAAYGSLFHPYVKILRDFRDRFLLQSDAGRLFTDTYYRYSPPAADFIARHPVARRVVQLALLPIVGSGWLLMQFGVAGFLVMITVTLVSGVFVHRSWRRMHAV